MKIGPGYGSMHSLLLIIGKLMGVWSSPHCSETLHIYNTNIFIGQTPPSFLSVSIVSFCWQFSYIKAVTKKDDSSSPLNYQISCNFSFLHFLKILTPSLSETFSNISLLAMSTAGFLEKRCTSGLLASLIESWLSLIEYFVKPPRPPTGYFINVSVSFYLTFHFCALYWSYGVWSLLSPKYLYINTVLWQVSAWSFFHQLAQSMSMLYQLIHWWFSIISTSIVTRFCQHDFNDIRDAK